MSCRAAVRAVAFASVVATAFASHATNKRECDESVSESTPWAAKLHGRVFDPDGRPLALVLVSAVPHGAPVHDHPTHRAYHAADDDCLVEMLKRSSEKAASALTDEAGLFILPLPGKELHDIRLQARGYVLQDISNVPLDPHLAVHMRRGARVSGQVTDGGNPLAQAKIFFQPVGDDGRFPYIGYRVSTDAKGSYSLSGLGEGEYLLDVQLEHEGNRHMISRRLLVETSSEFKLDVKVDEPNNDLREVFHRWYARHRDSGPQAD